MAWRQARVSNYHLSSIILSLSYRGGVHPASKQQWFLEHGVSFSVIFTRFFIRKPGIQDDFFLLSWFPYNIFSVSISWFHYDLKNPLVFLQSQTKNSMIGTSVKTPTTVAKAAPDFTPKSVVATAIATSK